VDLIEIEELHLRCVIGCRVEERRGLSDVVLSLLIGTDATAAGTSDRLEDAWDYATCKKAIVAAVEASSFQTVEALATAVARIVVIDHAAPYVQVTVAKPGALRFARTVGLRIERTPEDFGPVGTRR
jgi:FolB domain-containing protein